MDVPATLTDIAEQLRKQARVDTIFGDPIVSEIRTVVPVARVVSGLGGGYGASASPADPVVADDASEAERHANDAGNRTGERRDGQAIRTPTDAEGGGLGGGVVATPVGVVEITVTGTRFVRTGGRRRLLAALGVGAVTSYLLGRRATRGDR